MVMLPFPKRERPALFAFLSYYYFCFFFVGLSKKKQNPIPPPSPFLFFFLSSPECLMPIFFAFFPSSQYPFSSFIGFSEHSYSSLLLSFFSLSSFFLHFSFFLFKALKWANTWGSCFPHLIENHGILSLLLCFFIF